MHACFRLDSKLALLLTKLILHTPFFKSFYLHLQPVMEIKLCRAVYVSVPLALQVQMVMVIVHAQLGNY